MGFMDKRMFAFFVVAGLAGLGCSKTYDDDAKMDGHIKAALLY